MASASVFVSMAWVSNVVVWEVEVVTRVDAVLVCSVVVNSVFQYVCVVRPAYCFFFFHVIR